MKNLILVTLASLGLFMPKLKAQPANIPLDTVKVYENLQLTATVICNTPWQESTQKETARLLQDFFRNLEQVADQIPDYADYEIFYLQNASLKVVEKPQDLSVFVAQNGKILSSSTKKAQLRTPTTTVLLYFETLDELRTKDYAEMLSEAMKDVRGSNFGRAFGSAISHNYSFDERRRLKYKEINPLAKSRFFLVGNAAIGVYRNKPQFEFGEGFGIRLGSNLEKLLYTTLSVVAQYNDENKQTETVGLWSIHYKPSKLYSFEIGFPVRGGILDFNSELYPLEDYGVRMGVAFYPVQGISLRPTFHYVFPEDESNEDLNLHFGFSVGYGF